MIVIVIVIMMVREFLLLLLANSDQHSALTLLLVSLYQHCHCHDSHCHCHHDGQRVPAAATGQLRSALSSHAAVSLIVSTLSLSVAETHVSLCPYDCHRHCQHRDCDFCQVNKFIHSSSLSSLSCQSLSWLLLSLSSALSSHLVCICVFMFHTA